MNTRGIALAADSAVTLGDGEKIYDNAEKLLQLAPSAPIGVMTFGSADLMDVPWEIIVAGYRQHLGDRRYDTLVEYFEDFVTFIEGAVTMFPDTLQRERFGKIAYDLWDWLYTRPWKQELEKHRRRNGRDPHGVLRRLIAEDHTKWEVHPPLDRFDSGFPDAVINDYGTVLDEAERKLFGPPELPEDIRTSLRTTIRLFLSRAGFLGPQNSGLVIAGMGETEPFPSLLYSRVGPVVKGRLKLHVFDHVRITHDATGIISPFAQHETIDMIIQGIHPGLTESLPTFMANSLKARPRRKEVTGDNAPVAVERFKKSMQEEISEKHSGPFMAAVSALPRHDLAAMAEALVNLTAFRAHASADERETVAGPIDVAILSKGDGFVWVKRKRFSVA
jgi:hypothetical protein